MHISIYSSSCIIFSKDIIISSACTQMLGNNNRQLASVSITLTLPTVESLRISHFWMTLIFLLYQHKKFYQLYTYLPQLTTYLVYAIITFSVCISLREGIPTEYWCLHDIIHYVVLRGDNLILRLKPIRTIILVIKEQIISVN
jgi:hypothetical protein